MACPQFGLMRQGLQFGISIALARLLSPEEFGTIALLYLFTGIASAFVDSGFSSALIQRQDITHTDESTVFWFNLAIGALVAISLWAAAPLIARFFVLPVLLPLTGLLALNIFLSALGSIHGTLLTKHLNFRVQMKICDCYHHGLLWLWRLGISRTNVSSNNPYNVTVMVS